jgi:hypothetical protein
VKGDGPRFEWPVRDRRIGDRQRSKIDLLRVDSLALLVHASRNASLRRSLETCEISPHPDRLREGSRLDGDIQHTATEDLLLP